MKTKTPSAYDNLRRCQNFLTMERHTISVIFTVIVLLCFGVPVSRGQNGRIINSLAYLGNHLTVLRCVVSNAAGNATSAGEFLFVTTTVKAPTDITSFIKICSLEENVSRLKRRLLVESKNPLT